MDEQTIQNVAEMLPSLSAFPTKVSVYPTAGSTNLFLLLIEQHQIQKNLDDWALNAVYPLLWEINALIEEKNLTDHIIVMFSCDDKFSLHTQNNVLAEMPSPPRGEWFGFQQNNHFLGYSYNVGKILEFLTKTPNLKF